MKFVPLEKDEFLIDEYDMVRVKLGYEGGVKSDDRLRLSVRTFDSIDERYVGSDEGDVLFRKDNSELKNEYFTEKGEVVIESSDRNFDTDVFTFLGKDYKVRKFIHVKGISGEFVTITVATNEDVRELVNAFDKVSLFSADEFYTMNVCYNDPIAQSDSKLRSVLAGIEQGDALNDSGAYLGEVRFRSEEKAGLMVIYGSLFFLGAFLGTLFVLDTVLIIYYKQLTEGYEDASRFRIMRSVGMSDDEVRSSIRSQILLVFFLPLVVALIHTVFAFPIVGRMLVSIGLDNTSTYFRSCLFGFVGYVILYTAIYLLTSAMYYGIIKKQK